MQQVANRIAILHRIQTTQTRSVLVRSLRMYGFQLAGNPVDHGEPLFARRLRLVFGRHLAEIKQVQDFLPIPCRVYVMKIQRQFVESPISLLLFFAMAIDAMGLKEIEGFDRGIGSFGPSAKRKSNAENRCSERAHTALNKLGQSFESPRTRRKLVNLHAETL